jgi:hypothetical protein
MTVSVYADIGGASATVEEAFRLVRLEKRLLRLSERLTELSACDNDAGPIWFFRRRSPIPGGSPGAAPRASPRSRPRE